MAKLDAAVSALLVDHPLKKEIDAVRRLVLGVDPSISEAVKWNSASFRTTDFFATVHLRSRDTVQLVFHMGAKTKRTAQTGVAIPDPSGLCRWLGKYRCLVTLGAGAQFKKNGPAFKALVKEWITWVQ